MTKLYLDVWIKQKGKEHSQLFHHEITSDEIEEIVKQRYLNGEEGLPMYIDTEGMEVEVETSKVEVN